MKISVPILKEGERMHEMFMKKAIDLAKKGIGGVNPNPLVGAIIVKGGEIIGKGYHKICGEAHAEVNAVASAKESCEGATMYVTLEPCSHYGKTPPCADLIIEHKFKKVYIASLDPNPLVAGRGVKKLRDAGIEVEIGLLENEAKNINPVFFKWVSNNPFPYVYLKFAITLDGKIALHNGSSQWISNDKTLNLSHRLRNRFMAIMVGVNTLLVDNPRLNCRLKKGRNPIRIVVDSHLKVPFDSNFVRLGMEDKKSIIVTSSENINSDKYLELMDLGIRIITLDGFHFNFRDVMAKLKVIGIDSVLVEGGSHIITSVFKEEIYDEGTVVVAPKFTGEEGALSFVHGFTPEKMSDSYNLPNVKFKIFGDNIAINFRK